MLLPSSSSDVSSLPEFFLSRACVRRAACDAPARFLGDPVRLAGFALTLSVRVGSSLPRRKATHPASKEAPAPGTLPNPRNCAICSSANEFLGGHVCFLSCFSLSFSLLLSLSLFRFPLPAMGQVLLLWEQSVSFKCVELVVG